MRQDERKALSALSFDWALVPDDVWRPDPLHVQGLHPEIEQSILSTLDKVSAQPDSAPIGLTLQGQNGSGKTHLLGWVRARAQERQGYFFLVSLLDAKGFWGSVVQSIGEGLFRPGAEPGDTQLRTMLRALGTAIGAPRTVRRAIAGDTTLTRETLDTFIEHLIAFDALVGRECQETARALALLDSDDSHLREIGETYLQSVEDLHGERPDWGMRRAPRVPELIVRDLSWLLALTGPTIIAVDQVDTLIAQSVQSLDHAGGHEQVSDVMLEQIAGGLMALRDRTRRTLTLLACLPDSWILIKERATSTVQDRFRVGAQLKTIPTAAVAEELIAKRFAKHFADVGFTPDYPTWPVRASAFRDAPGYTPRELLKEIDRHVQSCVLHDEVRELDKLGSAAHILPVIDKPLSTGEFADLDARYAALQAAADIADEGQNEVEDAVMPRILAAGLTAWIVECGDAGQAFSVDPLPSANPNLHARLRRTLDERTDDQVHWGFRAIGARHPVAALNRLRKAATAAGLTAGIPKRKLFVLRSAPWSDGPKTKQALEEFASQGGRVVPIGDDDLRSLSALHQLLAENPPNLRAWLAQRRPAGRIELLRTVLPSASADAVVAERPVPSHDARDPSRNAPIDELPAGDTPVRRLPVRDTPAGALTPYLTIGASFEGDRPVNIELEALRKHTVIFAGSGSGKTVLIKRLVEECALQGVSAVVLDPNNDLARLGDPWPEPPTAWGPHDAEKASRYFAETDVVVWTPRREAGRPLTFQPLPDFSGVRDDPDEFGEAVEAAVASLVPRARLDGRAAKAHLGQAVLRKAVQYYGRQGGSRLKGLIELLSALPDGVSDLDDAEKIAASLAQTLTAAMDNDPLFGGSGTPLDPGVLLTPAPGYRARISVISFAGLSSDDQRQSFVNQLQMALFAWIKRNPAGDRPLGGLFVMDEAQTLAPSGAMTACTQSTLALASQARKYGLGLVFATQSPKGLHNRIPGNAATQFFGLLNAPIQIAAAREMAQAKGGDVPDISRLRTGQFYSAVEGGSFEKIRTPLCLSYHRSPLTTEEVITRASRRAS